MNKQCTAKVSEWLIRAFSLEENLIPEKRSWSELRVHGLRHTATWNDNIASKVDYQAIISLADSKLGSQSEDSLLYNLLCVSSVNEIYERSYGGMKFRCFFFQSKSLLW